MAKRIIWICDRCGKEAIGFVIPPSWVEVSFFNTVRDKFFRYCFCGYVCLTQWSEKRGAYYGNKHAEEIGNAKN